MTPSFEILDIRVLRPHERTEEDLLRRTAAEIEQDGTLFHPILVERDHHVILDGHHRYEALKRLGCRRVPAYVVDYLSEEIGLTTWPGAIVARVTKQEVVDRGLRGELFPPKTTRHRVRVPLEERPVPLDALR